MAPPIIDALTRLRSKIKIDPLTDCWLWTATVVWSSRRGQCYGTFWWKGKQHRAHRVAYELFYGVDPGEQMVLHTCDVGVCVNPDHLKLGDHLTNMQEMLDRGRHMHGETHYRAKLTEAQVLEIRSRIGNSNRELAEKFKVSIPVIKDIRHRRSWKHI